MKTIKLGIVGSRSRNEPEDKKIIEGVLVYYLNKNKANIVVVSRWMPKRCRQIC